MSAAGTPVLSAVENVEKLARFVFFRRWVRLDQTMRGEAFEPPPTGLSVTRHSNLSPTELWGIGQKIATERKPPTTLLGRADVTAQKVRQTRLDVVPKPLPGNPNHAEILGWPADKPARMNLAQQL